MLDDQARRRLGDEDGVVLSTVCHRHAKMALAPRSLRNYPQRAPTHRLVRPDCVGTHFACLALRPAATHLPQPWRVVEALAAIRREWRGQRRPIQRPLRARATQTRSRRDLSQFDRVLVERGAPHKPFRLQIEVPLAFSGKAASSFHPPNAPQSPGYLCEVACRRSGLHRSIQKRRQPDSGRRIRAEGPPPP